MKPLSPRQTDCLNAICAHIDAHGYPPSVRELAVAMGVAGTNAVIGHLRAMERKGWITRPPGLSRVIIVHARARDQTISVDSNGHVPTDMS